MSAKFSEIKLRLIMLYVIISIYHLLPIALYRTEKIFKTDLRIRHTFWNMAIDSVLGAISMYGTTQMSVMRAIALKPTHRRL